MTDSKLERHGWEEEEIDLSASVRVLWGSRLLILVGTLVAGVVAFGVASILPRQYEVSVTLAVSQPEEGNEVNTSGFATLLANRALAVQVIQEFRLDDQPHNLSPIEFVEKLQMERVAQSDLLRIGLRLGDPRLLVDVANRFAEGAVELNRRLNQSEAVLRRDFIKTELDQAAERLSTAGSELLAYRGEAQVELAERDTDSLLSARRGLLNLLVRIESEKARLARAEEELATRERIMSVRRSIGDEPALMEGARQAGEESLLSLQMRSESLNPVYQQLDSQVADTRTRLSALEGERDELVGELKLGANQLSQLSDLYEKELQLERFETEHELALTAYRDLSTRYDQARVQVASRTAELQIVDPALLPEDHVAPRPLRMAALAMGVTFPLLIIGVLGVSFLSKALRSDEQPSPQ